MTDAARTPTSIDYAPHVERWATDFVGRDWVLGRLDAWLVPGGPRFFRITGEPGSGKTALSSRLWQLSEGSVGAPAGLSRVGPGVIDAVHFCSGRERLWDDPLAFTRSVALQLADRHPAYAIALVERSGQVTVNISATQHAGDASVNARNVVINELHTAGASAEGAFNRLVREPLQALFAAGAARRVVILVDALDESLIHTGDSGILPLIAQADTLPAGVRFLVTSRPAVAEIDQQFAAIPDVGGLSLSVEEGRADVAAYVARRFREDAAVAAQAAALGGAAAARVAGAIADRAGNNFLYVRFLLDAVAAGQWSLRELDAPAAASHATGLDALYLLYLESLRRVTSDVGKRDWATQYAPLMETLSVAQEALTREQLRAFAGQAGPSFLANLADLRQFVGEARLGGGARTGYRLYHQSFVDFLQAPTLRKEHEDVENPFHLPAADAHARVADHLAQRYAPGWDAAADDGDEGAHQHAYALRHAASHYAGAAEQEPPQRHRRAAALVALVTDPSFQQAHEARLEDPTALRRDLERALAVAAADGDPGAPPLVVRSALALDALRREQTRPEEVFERARAGDVEGAERRLGLFYVEAGWRQAVTLTIAWLGAPASPDRARALRDRVAVAGVDPSLQRLAARLGAALDGAPAPPPPASWYAPTEWEVKQILERLGGNAVSGIEPLSVEHLQAAAEGISPEDAAPAYLAEEDGPRLVAFAVAGEAGPARGTEYLQQYIATQASNNYEFYRNRSLWALIPPVLEHPDDAWVLARLVELGRGALAGTRIHFRETLPIAVLALRAQAGDAAAAASLDAQTAAARDLAGRIAPMREGDPWAHLLRRLVALAEAQAVARGRADVASDLLDRAVALPFGFAGFNAMARLTVGELVRLVRPADRALLDRVLHTALSSAHNIQDFVFAARATSRVGAMRARWRAVPLDEPLRPLVAAFARDPGAARFAARHEVGESFALRTDARQRLPVPGWARGARTLEALARMHARPVAELARLNAPRGWRADDPIPVGAEVDVPDPEFTPLLAARLAAEVLTADALPPARRAALIQALAPAAAGDPTALSVVLARLLLAARPSDPGVLADLADSVARYVPAEVLEPIAAPAPGMPS